MFSMYVCTLLQKEKHLKVVEDRLLMTQFIQPEQKIYNDQFGGKSDELLPTFYIIYKKDACIAHLPFFRSHKL